MFFADGCNVGYFFEGYYKFQLMSCPCLVDD